MSALVIRRPKSRALLLDSRSAIDAVLLRRGWPSRKDVATLGKAVASLSAAYNDESTARAAPAMLPARLVFSFVRDAPKAAVCLEGIVDRVLANVGDGPLRILDVGAGLGAMTYGAIQLILSRAASTRIEATLTDCDGPSLGVARELLGLLFAEQKNVSVRVAEASATKPVTGSFDLILAGQVLSEMDRALPQDERAMAHADLIAGWLSGPLAGKGAVVVIEPALRARTRHLMGVRDALVRRGVTIALPCLHAGACPLLLTQDDWCYDDVDIDLPEWLVPIARQAGLRYQGLTFSRLVAVGPLGNVPLRPSHHLRVVSAPIVTKGKRELMLCGVHEGAPSALRVGRLDRHETTANEAYSRAARGDRLQMDPRLEGPRFRLLPETVVERIDDEPFDR